MANLASTLYADAALWTDHTPGHIDLDNALGAPSAGNSHTTKTSMIQLAHRTSVALTFQLTGDVDHIYVGHTPSIFPADPLNATIFDNKAVILLGDDLNAAMSI